MFDGAAVATAHELTPDALRTAEPATARQPASVASPAEADRNTDTASSASPAATEALPAQPAAAPQARQLLVVDNSVADWQQLVSGAAANTDVLVLDASRDGLSQIAERLVGETRYDAIHIMSHGTAGELELGNRVINAGNLAQFQVQLDAISHALAPGADLMLYGCNIGEGQYGADFLVALAQATHADVAASSDLTGAAARGGDWILETQVGQVDAGSPITETTKGAYSGLLYAASALTVVQTSEAASAPDQGNTVVPELADNVPVAVGEVVRMRIITNIAEGIDPFAEIRVALPDGLQFLNDGSAAIALVGDAGGVTATSVGVGAAMADGTVDTVATVAADIRTVRPTFALVNSGAGNTIENGTTSPTGAPGATQASFGSGDDVRFVLGDVADTNVDTDSEFIVIEYNVVVTNQLSNQAAVNGVPTATALGSNFVFESGGLTRFVSETDLLTINEPVVGSTDTHVVSVSGNTVTMQTSFTNTGNAALHDVVVADNFAGATNQTFGGFVSATGGATDSSTATALDVRVPSVAPGATVVVTYTINVTDLTQPVPARDAVVTGTSLSTGGTTLVVRDGETATGAPIPGLTSSLTTGERSGADGVGADAAVLNNYQGVAGAGLSTIEGTVWDDTLTPNTTVDAIDNGLGGVTVNMAWAGPDNVFGTGDDRNFTTVTSTTAGSEGVYMFGALPAGDYRITVPTTLTDPQAGPQRIYFDRIPASVQNDGLIAVSVPAGANAYGQADFGYLRQNAAPVVASGGAITLDQDVVTGFTGTNLISISDPDLAESPNPSPLPATYETRVNVGQGVLTVPAIAGVAVAGNGTGTLTLTGTVATINQALAAMTYTPNAGFAGNDTLQVQVNDRGSIGEVDNNGVPNEVVADNLSSIASLPLTIAAAPVVPPPVVPPEPPVVPPIIVPPFPPPPTDRPPSSPPPIDFSPIPPTTVPIPPFTDLITLNDDFDPYAPWTSNLVFSPIKPPTDVQSKGVIATQGVNAANVKGARLDDDCVDVVKNKPKAKTRHSSMSQAVSEKVKPFSEQLNAQRRAFKPPVKVVPKSPPKC